MTHPTSREAEEGVLGCILLDSAFCTPILARRGVSPAWFYDGRWAEVFVLLGQMIADKVPVDAVTLAPRISSLRNAQIDLVHVLSLGDSVPSAQNLEYYLTAC